MAHKPGAMAMVNQHPAENPIQVHMLPLRPHHDKVGVKPTTLSDKQSAYTGVPQDGPFKSDH